MTTSSKTRIAMELISQPVSSNQLQLANFSFFQKKFASWLQPGLARG